jgi:pimeloyl-ACP methyl ester carboxylesterase
VNDKSEHQQLEVASGISLEVARRGQGRSIVCLHGMNGPIAGNLFFELLSRQADVVAPSHPGFGGSPLPDWMDRIDDLAYLYLDMLDALDLHDVILVGLCMGGWIATEIAIRSTQRLSKLVLVGSMGAKFTDRETREFPDIFALHPDTVTGLLWHDKSCAPSSSELTDGELEQVARNQEMAALFLWEPYMHNPKMPQRLHRIKIPTLVVRGAHDGLVSAANAKAVCKSLPSAHLETVESAGHFVEVEQPERLADRIIQFAAL